MMPKTPIPTFFGFIDGAWRLLIGDDARREIERRKYDWRYDAKRHVYTKTFKRNP
jgi:hypothetical protein